MTPGKIIGLVVFLLIPGLFLRGCFEQLNMESKDRAAIHPGMDLVEVFTVARNWTWAWPYTDEGESGSQISSYDGTQASFGDESYADWDSFLADVAERKEELLPYTRWIFTYRGPMYLKRSFSIQLEEGRVTRVSESRSWD